MASEFYSLVYEIVGQIPPGKAATYGQIALLAGRPRAARMVGAALHRAPASAGIPCHRVVFGDGSLCHDLVFGGRDLQRQMLAAEGVPFDREGRVVLSRCRWDGPSVGSEAGPHPPRAGEK